VKESILEMEVNIKYLCLD